MILEPPRTTWRLLVLWVFGVTLLHSPHGDPTSVAGPPGGNPWTIKTLWTHGGGPTYHGSMICRDSKDSTKKNGWFS